MLGREKHGNTTLSTTYCLSHLIAGPVLHHKEMMPQFARPETYRFSWDNMTISLTIFTIGLFKTDFIGQTENLMVLHKANW